MPNPNPAALTYLATRHSVPAKTYSGAVPSRDQIMDILTIAARTPDHGKLEPWRMIVLDRAAMIRLAGLAADRAQAMGADAEKTAKGRGQFDLGHCAVVVISSPKSAEKVPLAEQILSAGALCMNVVHAATASGWAACWLSGWPSHDAVFRAAGFGCTPEETVAGIIHIGTASVEIAPRPRPDLSRIVTWG